MRAWSVFCGASQYLALARCQRLSRGSGGARRGMPATLRPQLHASVKTRLSHDPGWNSCERTRTTMSGREFPRVHRCPCKTRVATRPYQDALTRPPCRGGLWPSTLSLSGHSIVLHSQNIAFPVPGQRSRREAHRSEVSIQSMLVYDRNCTHIHFGGCRWRTVKALWPHSRNRRTL